MAAFQAVRPKRGARSAGRHRAIRMPGSHPTRVVATINLKGGVGKTTMTVALAEFLAGEYGMRVLVVDLDPQTSATLVLIGEKGWRAANDAGATIANLFKSAISATGEPQDFDVESAIQRGVSPVTEVGTVDLLPSSLDLIDTQDRLALMPGSRFHTANPTEVLGKALAATLQDRTYDYVLIDCPPSMGIITLNGLGIAHGYLIPTIPDYLSTYGIPQIQTRIQAFAAEIGRPIAEVGIVLNKYRAASVVHRNNDRLLRSDPRLPPVFQAVIPEANQVAASAEYVTYSTLRKKYGNEHFKAFQELTGEFITAVDEAA